MMGAVLGAMIGRHMRGMCVVQMCIMHNVLFMF
jgi:hypothetical protein